MEQETELPEDLCADEAVCFIADRHHVSPRQLLRHFLYGEASIPLEDNEVEILKGLSELMKGLGKEVRNSKEGVKGVENDPNSKFAFLPKSIGYSTDSP